MTGGIDMKLFSRFQRKSQQLSERKEIQSLEELTEDEMKLIQGAASNDMNESIYQSYAWLAENRRLQS